MELSKGLKLKLPEDGDTYNSSLITDNTNALDTFMANIGGGSGVTSITNTTQFMTVADNFEIEVGGGSRLDILGNGYANIFLRFRNKVAITVDAKGMTGINANAIIGNMRPRYVPALTVPLSSGGSGPAINGYIAYSSNIVFRLFMGKITTIPIGTLLELEGTYPLSEVPTTMGLTHMQGNFDWEVHGRNLEMIDVQARRLDMLRNSSVFQWSFDVTGAIFLNSVEFNYTTNGRVTFKLNFKYTEPLSTGATGDIGNITLGVLMFDGVRYNPKSDISLFSTGTGPVIHGTVYKTGTVVLSSMMGNSQVLPITQNYGLYGEFFV